MVGGGGFEPPKASHLIYSQARLSASVPALSPILPPLTRSARTPLAWNGDTRMAERYVFFTAMNGRLYASSVGTHSAAEVALIFNPNTGDRMIHTAEELAAALQASAEKPLPMLWLWIAEGLEVHAHR